MLADVVLADVVLADVVLADARTTVVTEPSIEWTEREQKKRWTQRNGDR